MKRLKQMGLTPGYPDLFLAIPTPEFHGLFIEMKTKTGKVQKNQLAIHKMLMSVHFAVCVCYDWMEAMQVIEGYLEGLPIKLLA
jgi:hypothetical protein